MSASRLLARLFRYQAWANDDMLRALAALDPGRHAEERQLGLRLMNHCLVVNQIFAAHLAGRSHGFAADNTPDTPAPEALRRELAAVDRWYLDYAEAATPDLLAQPLPFTFTDGDPGFMSHEDILAHVVTHNGYHRGEAGRLLRQANDRAPLRGELPWDTYAVHLHRAEPERRRQGRAAP
ncbi:DinB family protein [Chromobacterium subtsugae]|uniref:DinB family protein n=1 Tax=Chromobacterium subtsugae TaxID=251747 RepID=A0ABS7FE41_9NEIS|nr:MULTISPECIES: DinB family protein [Chromobacterium]KUM04582.1 damage-inducible protein DinB [Chromobacterium subtsugae]KZE87421.1 damage-inducible protein DinB [Chromobacterium sp. F49]MBW7566564.1 DinB family protein [Chromobacterium subtsugae]MBW8288251.1 DinB family protein [Chromobacterium subtsugae]OBU87294.1 damage-inducible protein DinB [Chromobacterium subtsugae]